MEGIEAVSGGDRSCEWRGEDGDAREVRERGCCMGSGRKQLKGTGLISAKTNKKCKTFDKAKQYKK